MLAWTTVITAANAKSSRANSQSAFTSNITRLTTLITLQVRAASTTITTITVTITSRVMRKLNPLVTFTIQVKNCILIIFMVIKIDKGLTRWLSCKPNTSYNFICSKLILKLLCRGTGIQIFNVNTRYG